MPRNDESDESASGTGATPAKTDGRIALNEIDSPVLQQGIAYWRSLCGGRDFPSRGDVTPRGLSSLLRNTTLVRVLDGGQDYDYRIVGDAYVMAHGFSFQGKLWSETEKLAPGYHAMIKSIYDRIVRRKEPVALRGWIERSRQQFEPIYSEYVFLPLGADGATVDHILIFAVYAPREKLD